MPEAALGEIEALTRELGVEGQRTWRRKNPEEFQIRVAKRQLQAETALRSGLVFLDRGLVEGIAYCRAQRAAVPEELIELCRKADYQLVLLLELILPFDQRSSTGRSSDEAKARRLEEALEVAYAELDFPPIRVPAVPLEERADLILSIVNRHLGPLPI